MEKADIKAGRKYEISCISLLLFQVNFVPGRQGMDALRLIGITSRASKK